MRAYSVANKGKIMITALIGALIIPLVEILMLVWLTFSSVSYPIFVGTHGLQTISGGLGLHPIFGIMVTILVSYYYVAGYSSRIYTYIVGGAFTILWSLLGLSVENKNRDPVALLSQLSSSSYWSHIESSPGAPSWLLATWLLLASLAWRISLHTTLHSPKVDKTPLLSMQTVKFKLRGLFWLAMFSVLCFLLLKACGSAPSFGV